MILTYHTYVCICTRRTRVYACKCCGRRAGRAEPKIKVKHYFADGSCSLLSDAACSVLRSPPIFNNPIIIPHFTMPSIVRGDACIIFY